MKEEQSQVKQKKNLQEKSNSKKDLQKNTSFEKSSDSQQNQVGSQSQNEIKFQETVQKNKSEGQNIGKSQETSKSQKDSRGNTQVIVRFRPQNELEKDIPQSSSFEVNFPNEGSVLIINDETPNQFSFDRVFPMDTTQEKIFESFGDKLVTDIIEGYNGTIFAYGQTGSGKTYSMMGSDIYDEEMKGIIPRVATMIFDKIEETELDVQYILKCSMLEIYRENLRDLFEPEANELKIKESPLRGIYVEGLREESVITQEEIYAFLDLGSSNRIVAATGMNKQSSRSHSIFILEVNQKFPNGNERKGMLNLVDLAGSERIGKTNVKGENLEEAKKINLSLSALGNVIHALTTNSEHIPYRDSKLTRLLQYSLGGNFQTTLLIACSPHARNAEETLNTLKFAQRAKFVKNKPKQNVRRSAQYYLQIIAELKQELQECQAQLQNYQSTHSMKESKSEQDLQNKEEDQAATTFQQQKIGKQSF